MGDYSVIVLDFETTGLSPDNGDRAIEIGAVLVQNNQIVDRFQRLMNPGKRVNSFIQDYTGITNAMLKKAGATGETEVPLSAKPDAPRKAEKTGAAPIVPPVTLPRTFALLAKENQSKWKTVSGDWVFQKDALIGSGPSEIVYQEDLTPPFTLQYEIKVLQGMRPRVKYGRFKFANEGYEKTFGIYPAPKDAPLFHYELKTSYRVSISIGLDAVDFYVNGVLISKAPGVKNQPAQLKFCAGDNWSKGEVEYKNIIVTQTARPSTGTP